MNKYCFPKIPTRKKILKNHTFWKTKSFFKILIFLLRFLGNLTYYSLNHYPIPEIDTWGGEPRTSA